MSDSKGALKVILPIVLVAGGAAYWFFGIHQPGKEKAAAQAEVEEWGKQWTDARACLLGTEPASSDNRVALAARQLLPDPWDTPSCTQKLGGLTRKAGVDTGLAGVERAWTRQDLAVIALAKAFGDWVVNSKAGSLPVAANITKEDRLPAALDELSAAYDFLRESAGMSPAASAAKQEVPAGIIIPLKLGSEQLVGLEQESFLASGLAFARTREGYAQILLSPGGTPDVQPNQAGVIRSLSASWAATSIETGVRAGVPDAKGALPDTAPSVVAGGYGQVLGAIGDAANGLVVYTSGDGLQLIHSVGGTLTADPPIKNYSVNVTPDIAGKAIWIEWVDLAQTTFIARATDGGPVAFVPSPVNLFTYNEVCVSKTKVWRGSGGSIVAYDATGAASTWEAPTGFDIVGCSPGGLVVALREKDHYGVCGDDVTLGANPDPARAPVAVPSPTPAEGKAIEARMKCREVVITGARPYALQAASGTGPILVAVKDRAAAVWREGAPVQLFSLPERLFPIAVHANGKTIDVFGSLDAKDENRPLAIARFTLP